MASESMLDFLRAVDEPPVETLLAVEIFEAHELFGVGAGDEITSCAATGPSRSPQYIAKLPVHIIFAAPSVSLILRLSSQLVRTVC